MEGLSSIDSPLKYEPFLPMRISQCNRNLLKIYWGRKLDLQVENPTTFFLTPLL